MLGRTAGIQINILPEQYQYQWDLLVVYDLLLYTTGRAKQSSRNIS